MNAHSLRGEARMFGTNPCIDGYEVVANDTGHAVAVRASLASANGVAFNLNQAAANGQKALAAALTATRSRR